jgi:hypothetical protein
MQITEIRDDDPELAQIMATLRNPTYPLKAVIERGPFRTTKIFEEMAAGRLVTHLCGSRRIVFAANFGKWLLLLKREAESRPDRFARSDKLGGQAATAA